MPTKDNNIIKYNQAEKSIKMPFTTYADLECLLEKMSIHHCVTHYLLIVHSMNQNINLIIIEEMIV